MQKDQVLFKRTYSQNPKTSSEINQILINPGFGAYFTDHMVLADWTSKTGWHNARVVPYGPLELNPANAVFHYGQAVFEGIKAFSHQDGSVHIFRPKDNALRMIESAKRIMLPEVPQELFLESLRELIIADRAWIPPFGKEQSLYLRPFLIANEDFLGVRPAEKVLFCVISSPAASYFSDQKTPGITIYLEQVYSRAANGGTGAAKFGGNYASSMLSQSRAKERGCSQVLFLDAKEQKYIEELGGMNVMLVRSDGSILTPKSDTILPGITRNSIVDICSKEGRKVYFEDISIDYWKSAVQTGEIVEAMAVGTAATIAPISTIIADGFTIEHPPITQESLSLRLKSKLTGIQNGTFADEFGWLFRV